MTKIIASTVAESRLGAFAEIISKQFDDMDLSPMMVYLVDVVEASALPWLAKQFDVEGFKGFDQCRTEAQQRELIKSAINLHRNIGTIAAIRQACSIIGFEPKAINENVRVESLDATFWCAFNIELHPADLSTFDANSLTMLRKFIDYYKNARSILTEIFIGMAITEDKIFSTEGEERDTLTLIPTITANGDYSTDYSYDYF